MAARLYLRLADRDAGWISKLYDFYSDTPLEAARYLQLPDEAVMAEMGSVSEFKSMNVGYYDGEGRPVLRLSNSRIIVAMCSTLYSYGVLDTEEELEAYADYLWDASHDFQISLGEVYYCDGGCELASEAAQAGAEPEALEGSIAVSYTHRDVYKRQALCRSASFSSFSSASLCWALSFICCFACRRTRNTAPYAYACCL